MDSKTFWTSPGTSLGATMPRRTLSPRISTTVTVMSLLMTILSFFFLDSTSIDFYPFPAPGGLEDDDRVRHAPSPAGAATVGKGSAHDHVRVVRGGSAE